MLGSVRDHEREGMVDVRVEVEEVEVIMHGRVAHDGNGAAEDALPSNVGEVRERGRLVEVPLDLVLVLHELFHELVDRVYHALRL